MPDTGEMKTSLTMLGGAAVLAILAFLTAPGHATPDAFLDRGETFFPGFENPNEAASLEVIEFDEETAEARPFKVTNKSGLWTIPSHHDYPADGEDLLAETAAGVIGIRKEDVRSGNLSDHEACGVVDPMDAAATSLKGRGKRVTIRGKNDQVLADLIVGEELEDRPGFRFVRLPDQKRIYVTKIDTEISSEFADWIAKDLLDVDRSDIDRLYVKDYSIDERTGIVDQRDTVALDKNEADWKLDRVPAGRELDTTAVNDLLGALEELKIVGVRPKPQGLSESLTRADEEGLRISQNDLVSLQGKGYYFTRDGSLLSNEGELEVRTTGGVWYTLRFGELVFGQGESVSAGSDASDDASAGPGENRYLFITTTFDPKAFPEPAPPSSTEFEGKAEDDLTDADRKNRDLHQAYQEWEEKVKTGSELNDRLTRRFAGWYYVIPADSYNKVRITRSDLVKEPEAEGDS